MTKLRDVFFKKNGQYSKTAVFLSIATFILLGLWVFQSLFAGVSLGSGGWWTIPDFSPGAASSVMLTLATLYVANHSKIINGDYSELTKMKDARENMKNTIESGSD